MAVDELLDSAPHIINRDGRHTDAVRAGLHLAEVEAGLP